VLQVPRESEGVIQAGAPIIDIGDPRDLEMVVDLLSTDAVKVTPGAAVSIEDWGGPPLSGRVRRVEPNGFTKVSALGIEEQRVNVIVDFLGSPEARTALGHGYRIEARIVIWQAEEVMKLPVSALFRDGGAWAVFASADGRARIQHIGVGHMTALEAEVLGGLEVGQSVLLHPSDQVRDGSRIAQRQLN
jgi:HlyD family secretion protein